MHILSADQFNRSDIDTIFGRADFISGSIKEGARTMEATGGYPRRFWDRSSERGLGEHRDWLLATLFFEPSMRTRLSFEAAMKRLGGNVISVEDGSKASARKGESLEDTVRTISQYADCIALRSNEAGGVSRAATFSDVPVINAGDGDNEHPTQALLDFYTIRAEKGKIDGLKLLVTGDLRFGRTVHSFLKMAKLYDLEIWVDSPFELGLEGMPNEWGVKQCARSSGSSYPPVVEILKEVDVVYMSRIQVERLNSASECVDLGRRHRFLLTADKARTMKDDAIIMHPLPRMEEISTDVDADHRAVYFKQARYGLIVRMAILHWIMMGP